MVRGVKTRFESLILECSSEELSDAQIISRKKYAEGLKTLKNFLKIKDTSTKVPVSLPNGNESSNVSKPFAPVAALSTTGSAMVPQYLLIQNGQIVGSSIPQNGLPPAVKPTSGIAVSHKSVVSPVNTAKQNTTKGTAEKSSTALGRTRTFASKGTSGYKRKRSISPDIEVVTDMRTKYAKTTPISKPEAPKSSQDTSAKIILMLNIIVRPRNVVSVAEAVNLRKELDTKVKLSLVKSSQEFIEWLISEQLIRIQQRCPTHRLKLKLGMFADNRILPSSGGYVWIGDCCGRKYVSVYVGSIFGCTPVEKIPPSSILKLVYHWACQTSIQNVETWVKVEKYFIAKMYHYFRCICSVMVQDKLFDFGVNEGTVELGIVSLGTSTADGTKKAVKVEILGLYDRKTEAFRMFASTPEPGNSSRQRFFRILKPVSKVVHTSAFIMCDQSVDVSCLHAMMFTKVGVCESSDGENDANSNVHIMGYLRKHVPKIFQSTLSQLSLEQVQLVLDELCWREKFGSSAASCYDNIIEHVAYLTARESENPGLLHLLDYVSDNPQKTWRYKKPFEQPTAKNSSVLTPWILKTPPGGSFSVTSNMIHDVPSRNTSLLMHENKVIIGKQTPSEPKPPLFSPKSVLRDVHIDPKQNVASRTNNLQMQIVPLEPYYYGQIKGNSTLGLESLHQNFQCHICSVEFKESIEFYSHLKTHLTTEQNENNIPCKYCLSIFDSADRYDVHVKSVHTMGGNVSFWCRICVLPYSNEQSLKAHMIKWHEESDLPYRCEVCYFSTSFFYAIIEHFNEAHKCTPYIQCCVCLVVKHFTPSGSASFSSRVFSHMQKHSTKQKCPSCVLSFYSKYLLTEHRVKDHASCSSTEGLQRYLIPHGAKQIMFQLPIKIDPKAMVPQNRWARPSVAMSKTVMDIRNLTLEGDLEKKYCIECDGPFKLPQHFNRYQQCTKCSYATSCKNMIARHVQVFHPQGKKASYIIGSQINLPYTMYCFCAFSSTSGNHLARHIINCTENKKLTAYPASLNAEDSDDGGDITNYMSMSMQVGEDYDCKMP